MSTMTQDMGPDTVPLWLRAVATIGVVWYGFGLLQFWLGYSMDVGAAVAAGAITAPHGAAIAGTPVLVWLTFALASAAGLAGSALLFTGSTVSRLAFGLSLIAAAIYYAWIYVISGTGADRPGEELIIACVVVAVTLGFVLLSRRVA